MGSVTPNPETIALQVSPQAAKSFLAMPARQRAALQRLLSIRFEEAVAMSAEDFFKLMDKTAREAKRKGLTQRKLRQLLHED